MRSMYTMSKLHIYLFSPDASAVPNSSSTSACASNPNIDLASCNITASAPLPAATTSLPSSAVTTSNLSQGQPPVPSPQGKKRGLNLFTVKLHFLGDYVRHIRLFGTTDSYSTQLVCSYQFKPSQTNNCILTTGRTCPSTCEAALWPHKQKECNPADRQEILPAASFL
jgi:hypothetical protein